jgi:hypothetical protein
MIHADIRRWALTRSPRTANPCWQPGQYVRWYPGVYCPSPMSASVVFCASTGNAESTSQLLMRTGTVDCALSAYGAM